MVLRVAFVVPSLHWGGAACGICVAIFALGWCCARLLLAYVMSSVPVPPIVLLTDMAARSTPLAAHGPRSCPSVRIQPLTDTGMARHAKAEQGGSRHGQDFAGGLGTTVTDSPPPPSQPPAVSLGLRPNLRHDRTTFLFHGVVLVTR